nr:hypothetical protein [Bacteroidales bacterium]
VYVKFSSTSTIDVNDTLFVMKGEERVPGLIVKSKSSISCVCSPLEGYSLEIGELIFSNGYILEKDEDALEDSISAYNEVVASNDSSNVVAEEDEKSSAFKSSFSGRLSAISYADISNQSDNNLLKMRYILSLKADHISNSRFSAESYISFQHKKDQWDMVQENIFNGLKIYNLNIKYDAPTGTSFLLGRKINRHISNIGAIDGLQVQHGIGNFTIGALAGSRPDNEDYGFNADLFQYGSYVNHYKKFESGYLENSIAFMEQKNKGLTDRRFLYFQHSNNLIKNLYVFSSIEASLFKVEDSVGQNTFDLSSFYLMMRYRLSKKITLSASYDLRNNVIYYETYKNFLDQLIEQETRQGLNASFNYRISRTLSLGARGSYRYRKDDPQANTNFSLYVHTSKLPVSGMRGTLTSNLIKTSYLQGIMTGLRLNQDILSGKLSASIQYRLFNGKYAYHDTKNTQHIAEIQLNWNIYKRLTFAVSYETMLEKESLSNRVYVNLSKRF